MFTTMICATDGSEHGDRALEYAADIAQRGGAALHVVHVVEKLRGAKMAGQLNTHLDEDQLDDKVARQTRQIAAERDVSAALHLTVSRSGDVAPRIVDVTTETGGDLIVAGTRGRSAVVGALGGSVTQDLLHLAPCPVLAVPPIRPATQNPRRPAHSPPPADQRVPPEIADSHCRQPQHHARLTMFTNILWATDGSQHADEALPYAIHFVEHDQAQLHVVHVVEKLAGGRSTGLEAHLDEDDLIAKVNAQTARISSEHGITPTVHVVTDTSGRVAGRIAQIAEQAGVDLIVVGTRGRSALSGLVLGSVTQRLLHVTGCPVLAIPPTTVSAHSKPQPGALTSTG